jgi:hypothetical protein
MKTELEKIDQAKIVSRKSKAPFFFRWLWAKFHLRFLCDHCSEGTRMLRDLDNTRQCYWKTNWQAGNYDVPFWMGQKEYRRLKKIRSQKLAAGHSFPHIGSLESVLANLFKRSNRQ